MSRLFCNDCERTFHEFERGARPHCFYCGSSAVGKASEVGAHGDRPPVFIEKSPESSDREGNRSRLALIRIPRELVLKWFLMRCMGMPDVTYAVSISTTEAAPLLECEVVAVDHNFLSRMFEFIVRHPSFEPVPEGMVPPELECLKMMHLIDLRGPRPGFVRTTEFLPDGRTRIIDEETPSGAPQGYTRKE